MSPESMKHKVQKSIGPQKHKCNGDRSRYHVWIRYDCRFSEVYPICFNCSRCYAFFTATNQTAGVTGGPDMIETIMKSRNCCGWNFH
jgi:hypothetical protein